MKYFLYAIRDSKAGMYLAPFPAQNDSVAVRQFSDFCQNPQSEIVRHPEDYSVYLVGEWDSESSAMKSVETPKMLSHATNFVVK